jgi:hypothetical protein
MGKTTLIAQLFASFASAAFVVGYSTAETAELVAFGGSPDVDHRSDQARTAPGAVTDLRSARMV